MMGVATVREILLRAVRDRDFHNSLISDTDSALIGYDLSATELDAIKKPGPSLWQFINPEVIDPGPDDPSEPAEVGGPAPPFNPYAANSPTVVAVVIVVVYVVALAIEKDGDQWETYAQSLKPLIDEIGKTTGPKRAALVESLINEMIKGS